MKHRRDEITDQSADIPPRLLRENTRECRAAQRPPQTGDVFLPCFSQIVRKMDDIVKRSGFRQKSRSEQIPTAIP
jgi:hypothetical protein